MLRQIVVHPGEQQHAEITPGTRWIDIVSRGGDLIVSVGDGEQDVEFDGKILPSGHSATGLPVESESHQIAVMLAGEAGIGMLQVTERE